MITEVLGIGKSYITKIKKQAIDDDLLTVKGKMTPSGFDYVEG
jgi:hypothetical protein